MLFKKSYKLYILRGIPQVVHLFTFVLMVPTCNVLMRVSLMAESCVSLTLELFYLVFQQCSFGRCGYGRCLLLRCLVE